MSQGWRIQARHRVSDCTSQVSRHRETGHIRFQSGFHCEKQASLVNLPTHNVVVEQPKKIQPIFLFSQKGPRDQPQGTLCLHFFLMIRIEKSVSSQRLPELRVRTAGKHEEIVFIIHKNMVMLLRRIMKFSMRRTNLVCIIVLQSWSRSFNAYCVKCYSTKNKTARETMKS